MVFLLKKNLLFLLNQTYCVMKLADLLVVVGVLDDTHTSFEDRSEAAAVGVVQVAWLDFGWLGMVSLDVESALLAAEMAVSIAGRHVAGRQKAAQIEEQAKGPFAGQRFAGSHVHDQRLNCSRDSCCCCSWHRHSRRYGRIAKILDEDAVPAGRGMLTDLEASRPRGPRNCQSRRAKKACGMGTRHSDHYCLHRCCQSSMPCLVLED